MVQPLSVFKLEWDNHITATSSVHNEIYRLQTITWFPPLMLSYPSFSDTCEMGQTKVDVLIFEVKEIHEKACAQDPQGWPVAGSRIKSTSSQTLHNDLPVRNSCDICRPSARVHRDAHILLSNSLKAIVNLSSVKETILYAPVLTNCQFGSPGADTEAEFGLKGVY